MATFTFGAVGATNVAEGTYGYLQSFSYSYAADEATASNAMGAVAAQTIYNPVTTCSCEYVFDSTKTLPSVGDKIIVGATDAYTVMTVDKSETNTGYPTASIVMKRYTGVAGGIPANA